jgi:hypothetical protein
MWGVGFSPSFVSLLWVSGIPYAWSPTINKILAEFKNRTPLCSFFKQLKKLN